MELPLIDEHSVDIPAAPAPVWNALVTTLDGTFGRALSATYARAVRCEPPSSSGPRPLAKGSTVPGFAVTAADPEHSLTLAGRHAFSRYSLTFRLDELPNHTRLTAESRAEFPGPLGRAYRLLVVDTHFHVLAVNRMLAGVKRSALSPRPATERRSDRP